MRRYMTIPILPLAYDESLSYLEMISKLIKKTNEIVEAINSVTSDAVEQAKAYTDQAIAQQLVVIEDAVRQVEIIRDELVAENARFTQLVNAKLTLQDRKIDDLNANLIAGLNSANYYTDVAIEQNNEYILDEVAKGVVNLKVLNYFTGEYVSVQDMFDYLARFHLDDAITYTELANKEITYTELVDLHMTYTQLVTNGGAIIQ